RCTQRTALEGNVVIAFGCRLAPASVLGGPELDREVLLALTLPALHRVRPGRKPIAPPVDGAGPLQVRVLLAVAAAGVLEQHTAHALLLNHAVSPSVPARSSPGRRRLIAPPRRSRRAAAHARGTEPGAPTPGRPASSARAPGTGRAARRA